MKYLLGFLTLITITLWLVVFELPDDNLHIIACDVGQGDAILAVYKNIQILTDGGTPNGKVVNCLNRHMPFWDREIEVVVNTHPQLDHYGGLIEVLKKYKVDNFVGNALMASANEYQVLTNEVGGSGTRVINPTTGTSLRAGLISYDIFWPSLDFLTSEGMPALENKLSTFTSKRDPNDFSVQAILSLGNFNAILTGDIGHNVSELVLPYLPKRTVQYIKVPHHGSRYGLTPDYLNLLMPKIAVISVGKNNSYGHPTQEILDSLKNYNIKIYRTDTDSEVEIVTDGDKIWKVK
ncbi:MAG TPA: MBL fold metallo-hydrolase [Patescibacteria group bacterium]|nr:MBL fold metallo-hydrolase [Patescibacteria group bacterium]